MILIFLLPDLILRSLCTLYVSWKPDPDAKHVNALLMQWEEHYFYAFPPFSLIATCLQKIEQDQAPDSSMKVWYDIHDIVNDEGFAMHCRPISNSVNHLEVFGCERINRRFHGHRRHVGSEANAAKFTVNVWEKS